MKYLITLFLIGTLVSCGTRKNKDLQSAANPDDLSLQSSELFDTLFINTNFAVCWWPDSNDQVIMRQNYDQISYNKFVDDLTWYTEKAVEMLDSLGIDSRITDKDVIVFTDGNKSEISLKRKDVKGNLVLFNVEKEPLISTINDFNRKEIIDYFK